VERGQPPFVRLLCSRRALHNRKFILCNQVLGGYALYKTVKMST
jgi:hypothetical protein